MSQDYYAVWASCLRVIRAEVGEQSFRTWFERIAPIALHEQVLTIQVPNTFYYEFLEEQYAEELKLAIFQCLGPEGCIQYSVASVI